MQLSNLKNPNYNVMGNDIIKYALVQLRNVYFYAVYYYFAYTHFICFVNIRSIYVTTGI